MQAITIVIRQTTLFAALLVLRVLRCLSFFGLKWIAFQNRSFPARSLFKCNQTHDSSARLSLSVYTKAAMAHIHRFLVFIHHFFSRWRQCIFGPVEVRKVVEWKSSFLVTFLQTASKLHFILSLTRPAHTSICYEPHLSFFALCRNHTCIFLLKLISSLFFGQFSPTS